MLRLQRHLLQHLLLHELLLLKLLLLHQLLLYLQLLLRGNDLSSRKIRHSWKGHLRQLRPGRHP